MAAKEETTKDDALAVEEPEDKALQDQSFGTAMEERERRAEAGEPDPGEEPAEHAGGKA